jgi:hypothetical protein
MAIERRRERGLGFKGSRIQAKNEENDSTTKITRRRERYGGAG